MQRKVSLGDVLSVTESAVAGILGDVESRFTIDPIIVKDSALGIGGRSPREESENIPENIILNGDKQDQCSVTHRQNFDLSNILSPCNSLQRNTPPTSSGDDEDLRIQWEQDGQVQHFKPSDSLKQGVFVSPSTMKHSARIGKSPIRKQDEGTTKIVKDGRTKTTNRRRVTRGLQQGTERQETLDFEKPDDDVIATKFAPQARREDLLDKLKRLSDKGHIKKIVKPTILYQENNAMANVDTRSEVNSIDRIHDADQKGPVENRGSQSDYIPSVAEATSTALGPFLQIQSALEGQINSLVNTMKNVSQAEKDRERTEQEGRLLRLEEELSKLKRGYNQPAVSPLQFDVIKEDRHRSQAQAQQSNPNRNMKSPKRDNEMHIRYIDHKQRPEWKANSYHANARDIRSRLMQGLEDPLPTNIKATIQKRVAFMDEATSPPPISIVKLSDSQLNSFSSEASTVTDSSILETPMPRHRVPVPVVKSGRVPPTTKGKRKTAKKGIDILKTLLKEHDKENRHHITSSPTTVDQDKISPVDARSNSPPGDFSSFNILKKEMNDMIKDTELLRMKLNDVNKNIERGLTKESTESEDDGNEQTLVDRYLQMYPVRGRKDYLAETWAKPKRDIHDNCIVIDDAPVRRETTASQHPITATNILEDVAESRKKLESNIESVIRTRDQCRLYEMLENPSSGVNDDLAELKLKIDEKIKEISAEVERELADSAKHKADVTQNAVQRSKTGKGGKSNISKIGKDIVKQRNIPVQGTKGKKLVKGNNNMTNRKTEPIRETGKQTPKATVGSIIRPTHLERSYKTSVYGAPSYFPHRTTTRPSPQVTVSPKHRKEIPDRVVESKTRQSEKPSYQMPGGANEQHRYFFHQDNDPNLYPRVPPLHGNLVPMAIPIGKPRQDASLRLPLPLSTQNLEGEESLEEISPPNVLPPKVFEEGSNVAVFTINASDDDKSKDKRWKKRPQPKTAKLAIQKIPAIDIESIDESSVSSEPDKTIEKDNKDDKDNRKTISVVPPENADYDEFQNFMSIQDITPEIGQGDDNQEPVFSLDGQKKIQDPPYHGPDFPPRQPSPPILPSEKIKLDSVRPLEERAQEWLEQELLARIVSEMNNVPPDPALVGDIDTVRARATTQSESDSDSELDTKNWIDSLLGLQGLQLFIDAGIPVSEDLIKDLVKSVIDDILNTLFGYPKHEQDKSPEKAPEQDHDSVQRTPLSTPAMTPIYTPPESEHLSELRTPVPSSPEPSTTEESVVLQPEEPSPQSDRPTQSPTEILQTPPKTPSSETITTHKTKEDRAATPIPSESEGKAEGDDSLMIPTPESSKSEPQPDDNVPDFELTENSSSSSRMGKEELFVPSSPSPKPEEIKSVTVPVKSRSSNDWSISSATYTFNSSTPHSSAIDAISEGELLNPTQALSGPYSEGEFPVSQGQVPPTDELDEQDDMTSLDARQIMRRLSDRVNKSGASQNKLPSSLTLSPANTLKETEDIDEDTISGLTKSEGELSRHDPILKLLNRINTPPDVFHIASRAITPQTSGNVYKDRSEGEVSLGEEYPGTPAHAQSPAYQRPKSGPYSAGLSSGEILVDKVPSSLDRDKERENTRSSVESIPVEETNEHFVPSNVIEVQPSRQQSADIQPSRLDTSSAPAAGSDKPSFVQPTPALPKLITVVSRKDSSVLPDDSLKETELSKSGSNEKERERTKLLLTIPSADAGYDDPSENSLADLSDNLELEGPSANEISFSEGQL